MVIKQPQGCTTALQSHRIAGIRTAPITESQHGQGIVRFSRRRERFDRFYVCGAPMQMHTAVWTVATSASLSSRKRCNSNLLTWTCKINCSSGRSNCSTRTRSIAAARPIGSPLRKARGRADQMLSQASELLRSTL